MSKETIQWLRDNIKYGFTDERGPAWWRNSSDNAYLSDGSHFPEEVPEEEVRRLLDVKLIEGPVTSIFTNSKGERIPVIDKDGKHVLRVHDDERAEIMGTFKSGYQIHGYNEWINDAMADIADSRLQTACVALLRKGAVAFHQVKLPEQWEVQGFKFTPYFTGATSCDASLKTLWFTGADAAVCDNTFETARSGAQTRVGYKHTKGSVGRLAEARDTLGLTLKAGEDFAAMIEDLTKIDVSDEDFRLWLEEMAPTHDDKGNIKTGRGLTLALNQQETYKNLWLHDEKVKPWAGTGFGVLQLDSTYRTWNRTVQKAQGGRMERNLVNLAVGKQAAEDQLALDALKSVKDRKLVIAA